MTACAWDWTVDPSRANAMVFKFFFLTRDLGLPYSRWLIKSLSF